MDDLESVRFALERVIGTRVTVIPREEWDASLRAGGKPTRLPSTFGAYLRVQDNPDFEYAVASGAPHADEDGFHHVRRDEQDAPGGLFNTDSHVVIVDLIDDQCWGQVLRVAGLQDEQDLRELVRRHVFAYRKQRDDHHSPTIPSDIGEARPK